MIACACLGRPQFLQMPKFSDLRSSEYAAHACGDSITGANEASFLLDLVGVADLDLEMLLLGVATGEATCVVGPASAVAAGSADGGNSGDTLGTSSAANTAMPRWWVVYAVVAVWEMSDARAAASSASTRVFSARTIAASAFFAAAPVAAFSLAAFFAAAAATWTIKTTIGQGEEGITN